MTITIIEKTLTDRSTVYDVRLSSETLEAISQDDAADLAEKIRAAVSKHTNNTIETRWA